MSAISPSDSSGSMLPTPNSGGSPPTNPFIFPAGTVKILVTCKQESLLGWASADALVLASPVWNKFLFPPWDEPTPAGEVKQRQIDFTEDNGEALLVLLNIAHLKFGDVPMSIEYATLFQVAVLVDQYDCIKIVGPWLESWMENEYAESSKQGQEGWLFISWVFGRATIFLSLARHVALNAGFAIPASSGSIAEPGRGHLVMNGNALPEPMPPGIIDSIIKCRNQSLEYLLRIPYSRLATLECAMRSPTPACSIKPDNRVCDAALYGSLMFGLARGAIPLYPCPAPETLGCSPKNLVRHLCLFELHHIKRESPTNNSSSSPPFTLYGGNYVLPGGKQWCPEPSNPQDHRKCAVSMEASLVKVLDGVPTPALDSHRVHMQIQRRLAAKAAA